MPLKLKFRDFCKRLDSILFFGIFAGISKKIRYSKFADSGSWVDPSALLDKETVLVGNNKIYANVQINKTTVGKFTYVGPETKIALTTIGAFCSIGRCVSIGLGLHPTNWVTTHPAFYSIGGQTTQTFAKANLINENIPISIGHDVWIGTNAIVLDGVTIGTGAIVAAGAVVTKDVRPYAVVAGVPAREIKRRFDDEKVEELMAWNWWALPEEQLSLLAQHFNSDGEWSVSEIKVLIRSTTELDQLLQIEARNA